MKKFARCLLCALPLLFCIGIQLVTALVLGSATAIWLVLQEPVESAPLSVEQMTEHVLRLVPMLLFVAHGLTALGAALWYWLLDGRKKPVGPRRSMSAVTVLLVVCFGVALQLLISVVLNTVGSLIPEAFSQYEQLMDSLRLGESWFSLIAVSLLAPIGEELLFRGLTLRFAQKAGVGFAVANIIQAALFALAHFNLVQGSYAFVLGLLLGYAVKRYRSIYPAIAVHLVMNGSGVALGLAEALAEPLGGGVLLLIELALGAALLAAGLLLFQKDQKAKVVLKDVQ